MLILESLQPLMLARAAAAAARQGGGDGGASPMAPACSASLAAAWSAAMVESRHQLQAQQGLRGTQQQQAGGQEHSCQVCKPAAGEAPALSPEALQAAWAEAATDICEALAAAAELVAACQGMGRLQVGQPRAHPPPDRPPLADAVAAPPPLAGQRRVKASSAKAGGAGTHRHCAGALHPLPPRRR